MDGIASDRFVNRMPSMVDWASGQRAAASSSPLPLIDGHDVDNLAMGIIVFGLGAWEDLAKLTGNSALENEMIAKRMMEMHPGLKDALALSPGSSRLVSNALRAAASSLQLNDELMHDEISLDVDDATLLKALLASYGREATVKALKTKALLETLLRPTEPVAEEGDAAAFVFPSGKLPTLTSLPSLQHLMRGINSNNLTNPSAASVDVIIAPSTTEAGHPMPPSSSPPMPPAPTTSLTPPRSFGKPGGSFAGRKPPRPVSASPQVSTGPGPSQTDPTTKSCGNCGTTHTSLWRKVGDMVMCNACGIYYKNHGYHRPMDLALSKTTFSQTSGSVYGDLGGGAGASSGGGGGGGRGGRGGSSQVGEGNAGKKRRTPPLSVEANHLISPLLVKSQGLGEDTATSPLTRGSKGARKGFQAPSSSRASPPPPPPDPVDGASGEMEEDHAKIEYEDDLDGTDDAAMGGGGEGEGGARRSGRRRVAKKGYGEEWFEPSDMVLRREGQPLLKRPRQQSSAGGGGGYASEGYQSDYMDSQGGARRTDSRGGGAHLSRPLVSAGGAVAPPSPLRAVSTVQGGGGGGGRGEGGPSPSNAAADGDLAVEAHNNGVVAFEPGQSPLPSGLDGEGEGEGDEASSGSSDATDLRVDADTSLVALALMQLKEAKGRWGLLPKVLQSGGGGGKRSSNNTPAASFNPTRDPSPSPLRPSPAPSYHGGVRGGGDVAAGLVSTAATAGKRRTSSAGRPRSKSPYSGSHHHRASPEVTRTSGGGGGGGGGGGPGSVIQSCSNCGTTKTPMWRKDKITGALNCNACGIYRQTHGYDRPLSGGGGGSARNSADGSRGGGGGGGVARGDMTPPGSPLLVHGGGGGGGGLGLSWPPLLPPAPHPLPHTTILNLGGRPPLPLAARPPLPPSSLSKETFPQTTLHHTHPVAPAAHPLPPAAQPHLSPLAPPSSETMRAFEQLLSSMPGFPSHLFPTSSPAHPAPPSHAQPSSSVSASASASHLPFPFSLGMDLNALNRQIEVQQARQLQELQMHQQQLQMLQLLKQQAAAIQLGQQDQEKASTQVASGGGGSTHHVPEGEVGAEGQGAPNPAKLSIEVPASLSALGSELRSSRGGFASPIPLSSPVAGFLAAAAAKRLGSNSNLPAIGIIPVVTGAAATEGEGRVISSQPRPASPAIDLLLQQALHQHQQQASTQQADHPTASAATPTANPSDKGPR